MYEWICAWCFCRFLANYSGPSGVPCPPHSDPRQGHHRPSSLLIFHCPHTKRFSREGERERGKKGKHLPSVCRDVSDFFLNFISLFVWLPTKKKEAKSNFHIFFLVENLCWQISSVPMSTYYNAVSESLASCLLIAWFVFSACCISARFNRLDQRIPSSRTSTNTETVCQWAS